MNLKWRELNPKIIENCWTSRIDELVVEVWFKPNKRYFWAVTSEGHIIQQSDYLNGSIDEKEIVFQKVEDDVRKYFERMASHLE